VYGLHTGVQILSNSVRNANQSAASELISPRIIKIHNLPAQRIGNPRVVRFIGVRGKPLLSAFKISSVDATQHLK
jgi:hypothetical protein